MTDNQLHIVLKNYAERLACIRFELATDLPDEMRVVTQTKPFIRFQNTPEFIESVSIPVLNNLDSFIEELRTDARDLRESALKQKEKV